MKFHFNISLFSVTYIPYVSLQNLMLFKYNTYTVKLTHTLGGVKEEFEEGLPFLLFKRVTIVVN